MHMDKVLSQHEIDQLINEFGTVDDALVSDDDVVPYDFNRPNRLSREILRNLEKIYSNFARSASATLSLATRRRVEINIVSIEEIVLDEFIRSVPTPTMLNAFGMAPLKGTSVLELNLDIVFIMFDIICGGTGRPGAKRQLTDIEMAIMQKVLSKLIHEDMKNAWKEVISLSPKLLSIESNPQHIRLAGPADTTAVASLSINIGGHAGMLNMCTPFDVIEPVISKLTGVDPVSFENTGELNTDSFFTSKVSEAKVKLDAVLGSASITVEDLLDLSKGDVVLLDKGPSDNIDIEICENKKFLGIPGRVGKNLGVEIKDKFIKRKMANEKKGEDTAEMGS